MRLSARGFTLPWQLVELQDPGPVYFPASAGGFAARGGFSEARKIAPNQTTAHRSVPRLASGPILIPVLGWSPPYSRGPWSRSASEFLYCPCESNSTNRKKSISKGSHKIQTEPQTHRFTLDRIMLIIVYT